MLGFMVGRRTGVIGGGAGLDGRFLYVCEGSCVFKKIPLCVRRFSRV